MLTSPKYLDFIFRIRISWDKKTNGSGEELISFPTASEARQEVTQGSVKMSFHS